MLHGIHSRDRSSGGDYDDLLRQSPSTDDSAQSQTTPHQSAMFPLSDKHKYGRAPHTDTICYATGWTDRDAEGEYIASAPTFDENRPACIVDGARRCGYNVVYAHNIQKTDNPKSGDYVDEYGGYPVESVPVAAERVGATDAIQHHCAKFSDDFVWHVLIAGYVHDLQWLRTKTQEQ